MWDVGVLGGREEEYSRGRSWLESIEYEVGLL